MNSEPSPYKSATLTVELQANKMIHQDLNLIHLSQSQICYHYTMDHWVSSGLEPCSPHSQRGILPVKLKTPFVLRTGFEPVFLERKSSVLGHLDERSILAVPTGLEPATTRETVEHSNRLSYGTLKKYGHKKSIPFLWNALSKVLSTTLYQVIVASHITQSCSCS